MFTALGSGLRSQAALQIENAALRSSEVSLYYE